MFILLLLSLLCGAGCPPANDQVQLECQIFRLKNRGRTARLALSGPCFPLEHAVKGGNPGLWEFKGELCYSFLNSPRYLLIFRAAVGWLIRSALPTSTVVWYF